MDDNGLRRWGSRHPSSVDGCLAAVVLAAFESPGFDPYRHDGGTWWALWGVLVAAPMLFRRRYPVVAVAVSLLGAAGAFGSRAGPNWGILSEVTILVGPAVALAYAATVLSARSSRRLTIASAAIIFGVSIASGASPDALAAQLILVGGAWLTGDAIRVRRHENRLLHELVTQRAETATHAERNRIARELHDVVAHQLTVISIQAGAARLAAGDPKTLTAGLVAIEEASHQALTDVRRALGVLRTGDRTEGVFPPPDLGQIDLLADRLRAAGLPLVLTTTGDFSIVPAGIALSIYRILQEGLTNVLNHAGPVSTRVRLTCTTAAIRLDIRNDAPEGSHYPGSSEGGHGLIGMRERAAAYHGDLRAGALPAGGFEVTASIPLP